MKPDWCPEKEWRLAEGISTAWVGNPHVDRAAQDIARALLTARNQGRDEGLGEAAKTAINPGFIEARDSEWDEGVNFAKRFIADAINNAKRGDV